MPTAQLNGVDLYYEAQGTGPQMVLTHGSWTDGSTWGPAVGLLAEHREVVTWDRRGHSRSGSGDGPGSRAEDAADLAALIEHLGGGPVHVAGNSYGAIVTLTLVEGRPDLVASAALHEPPAMALLENAHDSDATVGVRLIGAEIDHVAASIEAGDHAHAAEYFIDHVALGPGSWAQLPAAFRAILTSNAPTFLDEVLDPTSATVDLLSLATAATPMLFTGGTESPTFFSAILDELTSLVPAAHFATIPGAGHLPHVTHPDAWASTLLEFQDTVAGMQLGVGR